MDAAIRRTALRVFPKAYMVVSGVRTIPRKTIRTVALKIFKQETALADRLEQQRLANIEQMRPMEILKIHGDIAQAKYAFSDRLIESFAAGSAANSTLNWFGIQKNRKELFRSAVILLKRGQALLVGKRNADAIAAFLQDPAAQQAQTIIESILTRPVGIKFSETCLERFTKIQTALIRELHLCDSKEKKKLQERKGKAPSWLLDAISGARKKK